MEENDSVKDEQMESAELTTRCCGSGSAGTPILSVYHKNGYRTVLTALPATFGAEITNETEVRIMPGVGEGSLRRVFPSRGQPGRNYLTARITGVTPVVSPLMMSQFCNVQVSGQLHDTRSTLCEEAEQGAGQGVEQGAGLLAVVDRGDCKFSEKAEHAAEAGYSGLVCIPLIL